MLSRNLKVRKVTLKDGKNARPEALIPALSSISYTGVLYLFVLKNSWDITHTSVPGFIRTGNSLTENNWALMVVLKLKLASESSGKLVKHADC